MTCEAQKTNVRVVENASRRRGVAQPGSAPGSGPGSRRFKSSRPDKEEQENRGPVSRFFSFSGAESAGRVDACSPSNNSYDHQIFLSRLTRINEHTAVVTAHNRDRSGGVLLRLAPELTDEQLVVAAVAGDRKAEEALIVRHAPRVTRVLMRILGGDPEVVDQAQEVLLRAMQDLPTLRDPRAFRSWLTTLAVMRARRVLQRRARWRWLFGERVQVEELDLPEQHDEAGRAALVAVYEVLNKLSEEERTAFALRYLEGMELTEVAQSMSVSLATAKRRIAEASKRFASLAKNQPALAPWLAESRFTQAEDA